MDNTTLWPKEKCIYQMPDIQQNRILFYSVPCFLTRGKFGFIDSKDWFLVLGYEDIVKNFYSGINSKYNFHDKLLHILGCNRIFVGFLLGIKGDVFSEITPL
jgi:hypothetical protein